MNRRLIRIPPLLAGPVHQTSGRARPQRAIAQTLLEGKLRSQDKELFCLERQIFGYFMVQSNYDDVQDD